MVFCNQISKNCTKEYTFVTILILIDGFLQYKLSVDEIVEQLSQSLF